MCSPSSWRFRMPERRNFRMPWILVLIFSQGLPLPSTCQSKEQPQVVNSLTKEQKIVHILNRTGFGPRPGDVERVRRMGLQNYLELQLHPSKSEDSAAESKLLGLKTLTMSSSELFEQYPPRIQRKSANVGKTFGEEQKERGDVPEE